MNGNNDGSPTFLTPEDRAKRIEAQIQRGRDSWRHACIAEELDDHGGCGAATVVVLDALLQVLELQLDELRELRQRSHANGPGPTSTLVPK